MSKIKKIYLILGIIWLLYLVAFIVSMFTAPSGGGEFAGLWIVIVFYPIMGILDITESFGATIVCSLLPIGILYGLLYINKNPTPPKRYFGLGIIILSLIISAGSATWAMYSQITRSANYSLIPASYFLDTQPAEVLARSAIKENDPAVCLAKEDKMSGIKRTIAEMNQCLIFAAKMSGLNKFCAAISDRDDLASCQEELKIMNHIASLKCQDEKQTRVACLLETCGNLNAAKFCILEKSHLQTNISWCKILDKGENKNSCLNGYYYAMASSTRNATWCNKFTGTLYLQNSANQESCSNAILFRAAVDARDKSLCDKMTGYAFINGNTWVKEDCYYRASK